MRKDFKIDGKYVVLSVSSQIQSPSVIVTVKLSDRMPDIDSISVAFPVKSMRSAEHFVMNTTEEEARRGFAKVMSEFGELLGKVNNVLSISSARSKALTASMMK
ncbi:lysogeny establishment protein [Escherichia coli]|nr:lysogeny establishment protein [Escherichia coli]